MNPDRDTTMVVRAWLHEPVTLDDGGLVEVLTQLPGIGRRRTGWLGRWSWERASAGWASRRSLRVTSVASLAAVAMLAAWAIVGQQPSPLTFDPGSLLYTRNGDIFVAAADGTDEQRLVSGASCCDWFGTARFAPDREAVAFINRGETQDDLTIVGVGGATLGIYPGGTTDLQYAWAPDSRRLAAVNAGPGAVGTIVGIDGKAITTLNLPTGWSPTDWAGEATASWSPDGHWIAVHGCDPSAPARECSHANQHYLLVATDSPQSLPLPAGGEYLAWAPNSRIATDDGECSLAILSPDGLTPQPVDWPDFGVCPLGLSWSPDNTGLAVAVGSPSDWTTNRLIVVGPDGTPRDVGMPTLHCGGRVAWSPDATRLLFTGQFDPVGPDGCGALTLWSVDALGGDPTPLVRNVDPRFDVASGR